jgi:hypothetical protein
MTLSFLLTLEGYKSILCPVPHPPAGPFPLVGKSICFYLLSDSVSLFADRHADDTTWVNKYRTQLKQIMSHTTGWPDGLVYWENCCPKPLQCIAAAICVVPVYPNAWYRRPVPPSPFLWPLAHRPHPSIVDPSARAVAAKAFRRPAFLSTAVHCSLVSLSM